ncbi:hypothetical protein PSAR109036_06170 [Psychrobacter arenosus]|uniref:hypothetical protein n=1 Tax=Psychrobacter arenosus TaxID=256326 RepID=UPI0019189997|nr:hypothetical protein [Psychrobacter arenosus]
MKFFIQTRSVFKDYRYLGSKAVDDSWLQKYDRCTSFEHPTIIAESDDSGWRVFLGGLPSSRLDKVSTPIRYSLIFSNTEHSDSGKNCLQPILHLINLWIQAIEDPTGSAYAEVTRIVDGLYAKDEIERLFETLKNQNIEAESVNDVPLPDTGIGRLLESIGDTYAEVTFESNIFSLLPNHCIYKALTNKSDFLAVCESIILGKYKEQLKNIAALYLNFIDEEKDLEGLELLYYDKYKYDFIIILKNVANPNAMNRIPKKKARQSQQKEKLPTIQETRQQSQNPIQKMQIKTKIILGVVFVMIVLIVVKRLIV